MGARGLLKRKMVCKMIKEEQMNLLASLGLASFFVSANDPFFILEV